MRIAFTSPRTTAHIQTLLSSPISTSPITCALWSMKAEDATRGWTPRWGRSTDRLYARHGSVIRGLRGPRCRAGSAAEGQQVIADRADLRLGVAIQLRVERLRII